MSITTKKRLTKVEKLAHKAAIGIVNILEMLIRDAATPKRVRRIHR